MTSPPASVTTDTPIVFIISHAEARGAEPHLAQVIEAVERPFEPAERLPVARISL